MCFRILAAVDVPRQMKLDALVRMTSFGGEGQAGGVRRHASHRFRLSTPGPQTSFVFQAPFLNAQAAISPWRAWVVDRASQAPEAPMPRPTGVASQGRTLKPAGRAQMKARGTRTPQRAMIVIHIGRTVSPAP